YEVVRSWVVKEASRLRKSQQGVLDLLPTLGRDIRTSQVVQNGLEDSSVLHSRSKDPLDVLHDKHCRHEFGDDMEVFQVEEMPMVCLWAIVSDAPVPGSPNNGIRLARRPTN